MQSRRRLIFCASMALLLLAARTGFAADAAPSEKEKDKVLRQLDDAAKKFNSTSAEFQFDSVETDPVPDKIVQKGTVYYERKGKTFRMAAHIRDENGKPAPKVYTYSDGVFKLFEGGNIDQVTTFAKASKFESYLMLGFGASGKDLEEKWEIKYLGSETLTEGKVSLKTEKLELVAKDPEVKKYISKATIWVDAETGVSRKQVFEQDAEHYRVSVYFDVKVNQPLPADAFTFKTDKKTTYVNR